MRLTMMSIALLAAAAALAGCWSLENPLDQGRCSEDCLVRGEVCFEGQCIDPSKVPPDPSLATPFYVPQRVQRDVDILFVLDNSNTMAAKQQQLFKQFGELLEALKIPGLGGKLPDLHIGVVTTDLGAGSYAVPSCEVSGGNGGKLFVSDKIPGCSTLPNPYLVYVDGKTNISHPLVTDPVELLKGAFQCVAGVGTGGCNFESPLEAAKLALDPKLGRNPGFVRQDAYLAVVFVTDEDDCSAKKPQLYDPTQAELNDPLGPLSSFRCFEFGVTCDCPGGSCTRSTVGVRKNCKPALDWLHKIDDYVSFFEGLKDPGRLVLFALAGPTDSVAVSMDGQHPVVSPSCQGAAGEARPALRIEALLAEVAKGGNRARFDEGLDTVAAAAVPANICTPSSYGPAMRLLGREIVSALGGTCLPRPPLTSGGGLACSKGDLLGGSGVSCVASCLDKADCSVTLKGSSTGTVNVQRCAQAKFQDPTDGDCGEACPCWRIVPRKDCVPGIDGTPYAVEILRSSVLAERGEVAEVRCRSTSHVWGGDDLAMLTQCK